jgi:ATP-dependent RNA helicase DDX31/DBP7
VLLAGQDALVRSPTGSGKTLAYLAPMVHCLSEQQPRINRADGTYAVVLVPTRELAVQVCGLFLGWRLLQVDTFTARR